MYDWKKILVSPSSDLRSVMKCIDKEALRIAVVVGEEHSMLGIVTDGDIRRALIAGSELTDQVFSVMNTSPVTVSADTTRQAAIKIMKDKDLLALPVVENGKIIGVTTLHLADSMPVYDNPVFIMAGGFGTRLRPLTDSCPKPMLKVGSKPILETVILQFKSSGFRNFYISTHYMPEIIRAHFGDGSELGVKITYIPEDTPLGTGGALGLLPEDIPKLPLIMVNGDVLTTIDFEKLLNEHNKHSGIATICVREYEYQVPYGVVESKDSLLTRMTEKPKYVYRVNAGIYVVDHAMLNSVEANRKVDMPTLLEENLSNGVHIYPFHEYWLDIGRMDDFERANKEIGQLGIFDE